MLPYPCPKFVLNNKPGNYFLQSGNMLRKFSGIKSLLSAIAVFLLAAFSLAGCASGSNLKREMPLNTLEGLKQRIAERFDDTTFSHAHWGVMIKSLKTGEVWYERNSQRMFNPASNEKIPTTASALLTLGPDFQFETKLSYLGEVNDSVLYGDLVVWSNGDPTLYTHFQKDPRELFHKWAGILHAMGIKKITGNVIGDDNAFDDDPFGYGWSFDGFDAWYSAEIGPLQLNENYVDFTVIPALSAGEKIRIEPNIPSSYFNVVNLLVPTDTGRTDYSVSRAFGTNDIVFKGYVKTGSKPFVESPSITNSTLFYSTVLKEVLEEENIIIGGKPEDCDRIKDWNLKSAGIQPLDTHMSPPLKEIIKGLMKRSQNLYAETMARIMGWKSTGLGTMEAGRKVVQETLKKMGIQPGSYRYMDGSGLSRYDYVSPAQLVTILTYMHNHPYWEYWRDSQPVAGVDGTLRSRMKGTKAQGNVRAKTGTIANVRGLSGYVTTEDGEEVVFSFLVNGHLLGGTDNERITDGVLELIASFNRGTSTPGVNITNK